jgi:hypothetical protein
MDTSFGLGRHLESKEAELGVISGVLQGSLCCVASSSQMEYVSHLLTNLLTLLTLFDVHLLDKET